MTYTITATNIREGFLQGGAFQFYPAALFPSVEPAHWLRTHFGVGGWSPLQRLSGMLTAHISTIAPHNGFTWHPHRGLEIYTWVLDGVLSHEDSLGNSGDIAAGQLQRMFSGDYIEHQELNRSEDFTRVVQIWFIADIRYYGLQPHYQQCQRDELPRYRSGDATIVTLVGDASPVEPHIDARLSAIVLDPAGKTELQPPRRGENLFLYVTGGTGRVTYRDNEMPLSEGAVILAHHSMSKAVFHSDPGTSLQCLNFYLPAFLS